MRERMRRVWWIAAVAVMVPGMAISQGRIQTLAVSGHAGSIPVVQREGRNYVEVEALAQLVNGSLSFSGTRVTLQLPGEGGASAAESGTAAPEAGGGFSKEFLRTGIEEVSTLREWHAALASAIENQYPLAQMGLASYQARALTNLRLAQAAAQTEADQSAAQLIASVYEKMKQLSDKYIAKRAKASYIAPDALQNDELNQSIIACGKSLGAMAASGQFVDDGACR